MIWSSLQTKVVLGIAGALVGGIALHEHDQHIQVQAVAEATEKSQDTYQKQLQAISADFDTKLKERDQLYQQSTKDLNQKFADAAKSQVEMAALLSRLGNLPVPITVTTPPPTKENPNPTPIVTVPQVDFSSVTGYAQACEACKLERDKLKADAVDREAQAELAQKTIDSLKTTNKTLAIAAKGGTWQQRTWKVIKVAVVAGGIGYVVGRAAH